MKKRRGMVGSAVMMWLASAAHGQTVPSAAAERALLDQYCVVCHNQRLKTAGLMLDQLDLAQVDKNADKWEKVVRKIRAGMMPPPGMRRPDPATYEGMTAWLENELDRHATANLPPP